MLTAEHPRIEADCVKGRAAVTDQTLQLIRVLKACCFRTSPPTLPMMREKELQRIIGETRADLLTRNLSLHTELMSDPASCPAFDVPGFVCVGIWTIGRNNRSPERQVQLSLTLQSRR